MYIVWVLFATVCTYIAALVTHVISPHAAGSGIPQMKVRLHFFLAAGTPSTFRLTTSKQYTTHTVYSARHDAEALLVRADAGRQIDRYAAASGDGAARAAVPQLVTHPSHPPPPTSTPRSHLFLWQRAAHRQRRWSDSNARSCKQTCLLRPPRHPRSSPLSFSHPPQVPLSTWPALSRSRCSSTSFTEF